mmetsp:Transcript_11197/g.28341  ORF Transcript_11197/g.28341 Transcript_11197/m.28341 type:complete len:440 (-) Transcript_11197:62-1381(-)
MLEVHVSRVAVLGNLVHCFGPDLHLNWEEVLRAQRNHRGVDALVVVGLGRGNEVLEAAWNGCPSGVDPAEDVVTHVVDVRHLLLHANGVPIRVTHRVGNHDQLGNVPHVTQLKAAGTQFLVQTVKRFRRRTNLYPVNKAHDLFVLPEHLPQVLPGVIQDLLLLVEEKPDPAPEGEVLLPLGEVEGELLQLAPNSEEAQQIRQGGEDCQGFLANLLLLVLGHVAQGAHVVQAVSQLDDDDSDLLGHGHEELLQVVRLRVGHDARVVRLVVFDRAGRVVVVLVLVQLAHPGLALNDVAHGNTEHGLNVVKARLVGVLDNVVEKSSNNGVHVHTKLAQNAGNRNGMDNKRVAAFPFLPLVRSVSELQCVRRLVQLVLRQVVEIRLEVTPESLEEHARFLRLLRCCGFPPPVEGLVVVEAPQPPASCPAARRPTPSQMATGGC